MKMLVLLTTSHKENLKTQQDITKLGLTNQLTVIFLTVVPVQHQGYSKMTENSIIIII
jgi:hypothetical protein